MGSDELQLSKSDATALYSEVQKSPWNQVSHSRGKDVYTEVNKQSKDVYTEVSKHPQNQPSSDVYAEVIPDANKQTKKSESSAEIVYSAPQFAEDPKATPLYTNSEVANRVNDPGMVHTLRGQTHSIFPTSYSNDHVDDDDDT